jgi:hypothetical protein
VVVAGPPTYVVVAGPYEDPPTYDVVVVGPPTAYVVVVAGPPTAYVVVGAPTV